MLNPRPDGALAVFGSGRTPAGSGLFRGAGGWTLVAVLVLASFVSGACQRDPREHGASLLESGQYQEAVDFLQDRVSEGSEMDMELVQIYGEALLRNKQPSLAVWPLRRAHKALGLKGNDLIPLIEAHVRGGAAAEATEIATAALIDAPDSLRLLQLRSGAHTSNLNHEAALADLDAILAISPDNFRQLEARLNVLVTLDRLDEAALAMQALVERTEANENLPPGVRSRYCATAALFAHKDGDYPEADRQFADCIALYPADPQVIGPYVEHLQGSGQALRILDLLTEAANSKEGKGRLLIQALLAAELRGLGREDEATEVLTRTAEYLEAPPGWLELADHYVAIDDMDGAADAILQAVTEKGGGEVIYGHLNEEGLFAYADILVQAGHLERAREILRYIGEPAHKLFIEARIFLVEGEAQQALETYQEAFKLWPANPGGRYLAAMASMKLGEFDRAADYYRDSLRSDPAATDAGVVLARMEMLRGGAAGAFTTLALYCNKTTCNRIALRLWIRSAVMAGGLEVLPVIMEAFSRSGFPADGLVEHARGVEVLIGPTEALAFLEKSGVLDSPEYFLSLASWTRLKAGQGQLESALERVQALSDNNPNSARARAALGMTLALDPSRLADSGAAYRKAVELDPRLAEARVLLARFLSETGDKDGAIEQYRAAAEIEPDEPTHGYQVALMLLEKGDEEAGEEALRDVLEQHPWHGDAATLLAGRALERGDSGPETLTRARLGALYAEGVGSGEALTILGRVRLERDEFSEAQAAFANLFKVGFQPAVSQYYLAQSLLGMGLRDEAVEALAGSLATEGTFPFADAARTQLDELERGEG